jgi:hypothetical protein
MNTKYETGYSFGPFESDAEPRFTWKAESYFLSLVSDEPVPHAHKARDQAIEAVSEMCQEWSESGLKIKVFDRDGTLVSTTTFD